MPLPSLLLLLLVFLPDCLADNSTSSHSVDCPNCIFPFLDHYGPIKRLHTTCTTIDGDSKPWCATEVDGDNKLTKRGYCTASCPGVQPPHVTDVHPGNTAGNCCKSPLIVVIIYDVFHSACGLANTRTVDTYILGGKDAGFGEFPWQVRQILYCLFILILFTRWEFFIVDVASPAWLPCLVGELSCPTAMLSRQLTA